jgi:hypothetical protein
MRIARAPSRRAGRSPREIMRRTVLVLSERRSAASVIEMSSSGVEGTEFSGSSHTVNLLRRNPT